MRLVSNGRRFQGSTEKYPSPFSTSAIAKGALRARRSSAGNRCHAGEGIQVVAVYLLRCADGSLYCGWTTDIQRRVAAHGSGTASRYTRSRRPVELAAVIPVADRSAALREEARIKRLPRAAKLQLIEATGTRR